MFSKLKAAFGFGKPAAAAAIPAVEYKGYRIVAAPYLNKSTYQTAGAIEKDAPDGLKRHEFVRADTYDNRDDAVAFTITKAQQMIDQMGDRLFK